MDSYRSVEQVFLHTPHRLVSTFSVIKTVDKPGISPQKSSSALPKPRMICVTVSRRIGKPGFKATLWVLKRVGSEYQIGKSYRLKHVLSLEGSQSAEDHPLCRLTFKVPGAARITGKKQVVLAYECATDEVQRELLGVVYSFCRDHEGVMPRLSGVGRADLKPHSPMGSTIASPPTIAMAISTRSAPCVWLATNGCSLLRAFVGPSRTCDGDPHLCSHSPRNRPWGRCCQRKIDTVHATRVDW